MSAAALLAADEARTARVALAAQRAGPAPREARSSLTAPESWLTAWFGGGAVKSGATVSEHTAFNVAVVRACIDVRALLVAMLPVKVYLRTPKGPEEQRDHAVARLLRGRVSDSQTSFKWRYASQVCHDLGGNAYSRIVRDRYGAPESIRFTKPADIAPRWNPDTEVLAYEHKGRVLTRDEVLHIANLSTNGLTGRSPLADLREVVGLAMTAEEFTARTFANGNRKPGVFTAHPGVSDLSKAKAAAEAYHTQYGGAQNAGKAPFIVGYDWKESGFSNADAELMALRKFSLEEVARVYHLPLHLLGATGPTLGSGVEQLNRALVDYTLAPLCANWEAEMNTTLLTEQEQDEGYYVKFVVDALLRGNPLQRAQVYQILRSIAAMDVNQIRRLEEWGEYPDGWAGDPRLPMNNQGGIATAASGAPASGAATEPTAAP